MVIHCFSSYLVLVFFFLSFLFARQNQIVFDDAKFSDDGICFNNVSTIRYIISGIDRQNEIACEILKLFFSFDGSDVILDHLSLDVIYSSRWKVLISKLRVLKNHFDVYDLFLKSDRNAYLKVKKISNVGKISALHCQIGYDEPLGWTFQSDTAIYEGDSISFLGNKVGIGRLKVSIPSIDLSTKSRSGLILYPNLLEDYSGFKYFPFSYYWFEGDNSLDLLLSPMLYYKDLGFSAQIRQFSHNLEISFYSEKFLANLLRTKKDKDEKKHKKSNVIFHFRSNNSFLDADIYWFNLGLYDEFIWRSMNYRDFSVLSKAYWGYAHFTLDPFRFSFLQRNNQRALRGEILITSFLKIKGERSFDEKIFADILVYKKIWKNLKFLLLVLDFEMKYPFIKGQDFTTFDLNLLKSKVDIKLDSPILHFGSFIIRGLIKAENQAVFLDLFRFLAHKFKKDIKLHGKFENKLSGEIAFLSLYCDGRFIWKDKQNFILELLPYFYYLYSVFIEKHNDKIYFGVSFLDDNKVFGLKIGSSNILLEFLFTIADIIKFKFLGSYNFVRNFSDFKENYKHKETYFNFGFDILLNAWKFSLSYGLKSQDSPSVYSVGISPREWLSFAEVEEIFKDLQLEKQKVLSLYDEFK